MRFGAVSSDLAQALAHDIEEATRERAECEAREERESVEREEAMLRDLAAVRKALIRADAREEEAMQRASDSEARERLIVRLTVAGVASGVIGVVVAIVALVA
jgi:hypothetical protein